MSTVQKEQTAILISIGKNLKVSQLEENLEEVTELCLAANLKPIGTLTQNLRNIDTAYLMKSGKRNSLKEMVEKLQPDYVIFNHSLSGVQTRNLEKFLKIHILDRTQLILEIFGQRAQSHEGKLQVELAQLMDQMPRMVGAWLGSLSRQRGGGASRGPGEKALETDRRQAQDRIKRIKEKLEKVRKSRIQHRSIRKKKNIPSFALIGYTNSGKSTLFNFLTKSKIETKNQVFMTLDPTTRKLFIPGTTGAVLTDTVGFIRDLPTQLIKAFKSTLEESAEADVILHVIDSSNPNKNQNIKVVNDLIESFGWNNKPIIYVFNKTDLLTSKFIPLQAKNQIYISAKTGHNIETLLVKLKESIEELNENMELFFPKGKEYKIYDLNRQATILKKEEGQMGTLCYIKIPAKDKSQWKKFLLPKNTY